MARRDGREELGGILAEHGGVGIVREDRGTGEEEAALLVEHLGLISGAGPDAAP